MPRLKVYISGPISNGDVEQNVRTACKAATELIKLGYAPLVPQLTAYLQSPVASLSAGFDHETWMEVDLPWVDVADVVLRLPGLSRGADREVTHAQVKGIPVFFSIEELKSWDGPLPVMAKEKEWKVGDRFTCECGGKDCKNGVVYTIDAIADDYVWVDIFSFRKSDIKRIPPVTRNSVPTDDTIGDFTTVTPRKGDSRFHQVLAEMGTLHDKKQLDYGAEGDPFANVRSSESWGIPAWQGAMIRACDKVKRLQSFAKNGTLANEGVEDSLIDLANYAVIALVLHRESKCVS